MKLISVWCVMLSVLCLGLVLCETTSDDSYLAALKHTQEAVETLGRILHFDCI